MGDLALIHNPDDVTSSWLTDVLAQAGYSGTVTGFTKKNVGTGLRYFISFGCIFKMTDSCRYI